MAKPLSERSKIMRKGISENPDVKNQELAHILNTQHPGHDFKPADIAQQKVQLKKATETTGFLPPEPPEEVQPAETAPSGGIAGGEATTEAGTHPAPSVARPGRPSGSGGFGPAEVKALAVLARRAGGVKALAPWLDLIAEMERR